MLPRSLEDCLWNMDVECVKFDGFSFIFSFLFWSGQLGYQNLIDFSREKVLAIDSGTSAIRIV